MLKIETFGKTDLIHFYNDNNKCVSQCSVVLYHEEFEIWALATYGGERRKGYATAMLKEVIARYAAVAPLCLFVEKRNQPAINLYQKCGFEIVGEYRGGAYAWKMLYKGEQ